MDKIEIGSFIVGVVAGMVVIHVVKVIVPTEFFFVAMIAILVITIIVAILVYRLLFSKTPH